METGEDRAGQAELSQGFVAVPRKHEPAIEGEQESEHRACRDERQPVTDQVLRQPTVPSWPREPISCWPADSERRKPGE